MRESRSLKNGMTSARMNANAQSVARMPAQTAQPNAVFEWRCLELRKMRKNMKRALTDWRLSSVRTYGAENNSKTYSVECTEEQNRREREREGNLLIRLY